MADTPGPWDQYKPQAQGPWTAYAKPVAAPAGPTTPASPEPSLGRRVLSGAEDFGLGAVYGVNQTLQGAAQLVGAGKAFERFAGMEAPTTAAGKAGEFTSDVAQVLVPAGDVAEGLKFAGMAPELAAKAAPFVEQAMRAGAFNFLQPAKDISRHFMNGLEGAMAGAGTEGATRGLGFLTHSFGKHAVDAARDEVVALADKYKVPLHLSQLLKSPTAKNVTTGVSKLPFSGYTAATKRITDAYNKAVARTVGIPGDVVNKDSVKDAIKSLSGRYDALWLSTHSDIGQAAIDRFAALGAKVRESGSMEARAQIPGLARRIMDDAKANGGVLNGQQLHSILKDDLRPKLNSKDSGVRDAALTIRAALIAGMPEEEQAALRGLDRRFGNLATLRTVFKGRKGVEGPLQPGALASHISAKYGLTPEMEELAKLGVFIRPPAAGSPTAERYLLYRGLGALGKLGEPGTLGGVALLGEVAPHFFGPAMGILGAGAVLGHALNSDAAATAYRALEGASVPAATNEALRKTAGGIAGATVALANRKPLEISVAAPENWSQFPKGTSAADAVAWDKAHGIDPTTGQPQSSLR